MFESPGAGGETQFTMLWQVHDLPATCNTKLGGCIVHASGTTLCCQHHVPTGDCAEGRRRRGYQRL